jgi:3',5'-nucleoside bisphosphate phosphatase
VKDGPVDFHIHSTFSSDGDFSPRQLAVMARENGFAAYCISDHDTVAAYPQAVEDGLAEGVEVVPSMEVTTLYQGREFHCLLPLLDWTHPIVDHIARYVSDARWVEARERVELLRTKAGLDITWAEVEVKAGTTPPLGVFIAQVVLERPASRRHPKLAKYYDVGRVPRPLQQFYVDFFTLDKEAYVPKRHIPLYEVLETAPASGAVPVLSHPGAYFQNATPEDLKDLRDHGLEGLEVFTSYHDEDQTRFFEAQARALDLVATAGSDFHGQVKPHVPFGLIKDGHYGMIDALRKRRRGAYGV